MPKSVSVLIDVTGIELTEAAGGQLVALGDIGGHGRVVADQPCRQHRAEDTPRGTARDRLLALHYRAGEEYDRVAGIYKQAVEHGASTGQYNAPLAALRDLDELWQWQSVGAIQDPDLVASYDALYAAARERLPDGADAMAYVTGSNPDEAAAGAALPPAEP